MKSKKVLFLIIPVCLAMVAAIVLLVLFVTGAFLSPKARVMLALSKTFGSGSIISEYSGNSNVSEYGYAPQYLADLLKVSDTFSSMEERGYSIDASYALKDFEPADNNGFYNPLSGVGMKVTGDIDTRNRIACCDLTMQYNFFKISLGKYYLNDTSVSVAMPSYFDGYLTLPTDTFGTSYNASYFPSVFGKIPQELESSISFSAFDLFCSPSPDKDAFMDIEDNLLALKDFYNTIEVEKTGETRPIVIGGKTQDCDEYKIMLDEDAVLSLIESYEDWYFSSNRETLEKYDTFYTYFAALDNSSTAPYSSLSDMTHGIFDAYKELLAVDHEIYVYLDNKDRLAAASYENELDTSGISSMLNGNLSDTMDNLIDEEYDMLDDLFDLFGYNLLDDDLSFSVGSGDADDVPGLPESCTVSAEIIFHGRDYLPERYEGTLLFDFDNGSSYEISYTGENRTETGDMHHSILNATLDLTDAGTTARYDMSYGVSYQTEDKNLMLEMTVTDENHMDILSIAIDSTTVVEDGTIEWELEELTLTTQSESGENEIVIAAEASVSPLQDRVPIPEGRERNLFTMSQGDFDLLFEEIIDNLW